MLGRYVLGRDMRALFGLRREHRRGIRRDVLRRRDMFVRLGEGRRVVLQRSGMRLGEGLLRSILLRRRDVFVRLGE